MPNGRQTGIFPAQCNAGWKLFLVPACNAEHSANRNFPCEVQCRVGAVSYTCVHCRTLGKQQFSLRIAMQGGSCFWYLRAMPNARQTGIFPAKCNAGWELFLIPACNAECSANRNFPCGVQCRVGAVDCRY